MRTWFGLVLALPLLAFAADDSAGARGWLGVHTDDLSRPMRVALDMEQGVLVTEVLAGSPAAQAGLEVGDIIHSLDGQAMGDGSALRWAVRDRPRQKVEVTVRRRGEERRVTVTLGTRKGNEPMLDFDWPAMPREALREARRALRGIGPSLKRELGRSDLSLDSLRREVEELRQELDQLRRKLTTK